MTHPQIMIIKSTHLLHLQRCLTGHLKCIEERDDDDSHDEVDWMMIDVDDNKSKNKRDDGLRIMIDDKSDDDLHHDDDDKSDVDLHDNLTNHHYASSSSAAIIRIMSLHLLDPIGLTRNLTRI